MQQATVDSTQSEQKLSRSLEVWLLIFEQIEGGV
jgi:hypothetical protein